MAEVIDSQQNIVAPQKGALARHIRESTRKKRLAAETPPYSYADFARDLLGKNLYPKQKECLEALTKAGSYVSFASCNGGGKTTEVIVSAILGHLVLTQGKVISTSGSFRQIKDQLTPALQALAPRFPQFRFLAERIETRRPNSFWDGFSTQEAGRFEGNHGSVDCPLLLIADEAKTVKDPIIGGAFERCRPPRQYCRILLASSPGYASGEFYRSQTVRASTLTHPPIRQRASECPHINPEEIAALRLKWGPEHPLVKSMVDCEFMEFVAGAVIQLQALDALLADPPPFDQRTIGEVKAFCDFAWSESASGDENVLALRKANRITIEAAFREKGIHAVAARFLSEFNRLGLRPHQIEGDADGEGANIIKLLRQMGWPIGSAHNGGAPRFNEHSANLASEFWCEGGQAIIQRRFILPDDPELYGQMLDRKIVPHNRGKLCIESKQAMRDPNREGGAVASSPDRADAVFGAMAPMPVTQAVPIMGQRREQHLDIPKDDFWSEREEQPHGVPGAWFG